MRNQRIIDSVKRAARDRYAWPGGYPLYILMSDGEPLCTQCARANFRQIARSTRDDVRGDWVAEGADIYWEGPPMQCAHCNTDIESAYGDPDNEEQTP